MVAAILRDQVGAMSSACTGPTRGNALWFSEIHKNRLVKIFAEDETGKYQSVCSFLSGVTCLFMCAYNRRRERALISSFAALRPKPALFDSPQHAARFVSLI